MAEVTKRHRELAYTAARDLAVPPEDSPADRWVETGNGEPPGVWLRIAEALADIEAAALATRASAVEPGEAEHLEEAARLLSEHMAWQLPKAALDGQAPRADLAAWLERERIRRAKR